MIKSLSIQNFRRFQNLQFESLDRVNLIIGKNNTGKTVVLEALYLLFCYGEAFNNFPSVFRSGQGQVDNFENFWMWLFYQKEIDKPIKIEVVDTAESPYCVESDTASGDEIRFKYIRPKMLDRVSSNTSVSRGEIKSRSQSMYWPNLIVFSTSPTSPTQDAELFNRIAVKRGGEDKLVELLQIVEPRLQGLRYLKLGSEPIVYADIGMENLIPTTQLGQGFNRLLRLFCETLYSQPHMVLIDEVENGIHYSTMNQVWKGVAKLARKQDLQIFATTHSFECIAYAHETFSAGDVYDLAVHRLEEDKTGSIQVVTYDQETLGTSLKLEWEVR